MKQTLGLILLLAIAAGAAAAAPPQPDYHPSMGDLMTMAVQPRHTKLALAGQAHNWTYAAYESSELRHAFDRVAKTIPVYRDNDIAGAAQQNMKAPLDALDAAIKARNAAAFTVAYGKVTKGCNACHQSNAHPEVVIKSPSANAFPDQDFRPRPGK
jgi:cytochrome c556